MWRTSRYSNEKLSLNNGMSLKGELVTNIFAVFYGSILFYCTGPWSNFLETKWNVAKRKKTMMTKTISYQGRLFKPVFSFQNVDSSFSPGPG